MENNTSPLAGSPAPVSGSKIGMIAVSVGLLIVGLVAGYFIGKSGSSDVAYQTATPMASVSSSPTSSSSIPSSWKTYISTRYSFQFQYPPDSTVQEFSDEVGEGVEVSSKTDKNLHFSIFRGGYVGGVPMTVESSTILANPNIRIVKTVEYEQNGPVGHELRWNRYIWKDSQGVGYEISFISDSGLERFVEPILLLLQFTTR